MQFVMEWEEVELNRNYNFVNNKEQLQMVKYKAMVKMVNSHTYTNYIGMDYIHKRTDTYMDYTNKNLYIHIRHFLIDCK